MEHKGLILLLVLFGVINCDFILKTSKCWDVTGIMVNVKAYTKDGFTSDISISNERFSSLKIEPRRIYYYRAKNIFSLKYQTAVEEKIKPIYFRSHKSLEFRISFTSHNLETKLDTMDLLVETKKFCYEPVDYLRNNTMGSSVFCCEFDFSKALI